MKSYKFSIKTALCFLSLFAYSTMTFAEEIDWLKLKKLKDMELIEYVKKLNLKDHAAIDFWKKIPLSKANKQVYKMFQKEAFAIYMNKYPRQRSKALDFKVGMGTVIKGPMSKQTLKLPFTDYYPLKEGPVGNPEKRYNIGYTIHGFNHPWLLNNADSAIWEANRHPNLKLTVLDPEFDNNKQIQHIDAWVEEKIDGIITWPMQEAPIGPPVNRAIEKGIPCVSVDRMAGTNKINARITGNFPANGAQQGMYLIHKLLQNKRKVKGSIIMVRKPLGSTADSMRTGHFLKVISYFPGIRILESFHNNSNREESFRQVGKALKTYPEIDAIFATGAEQSMGAIQAIDDANMWDRKIIILNNDDSFEALAAVQNDKLAMTAPYTPLLGALAVRILIKILNGEEVPRDIITPDLPMVTKEKENVFGLNTISVKEWLPYAYGRDESSN